jgi:hypothetical protein
LETHLRDTVTELQRRGLNDQESFWLARKRIGQPKELREEFVKTNPERVWRERVFWMMAGIWIVGLCGFIIVPTEGILLNLLSVPHLNQIFALNFGLIFIVHLLVIAALMSVGFARKAKLLNGLLQNRLRLATVFLVSSWIACLQMENLLRQIHGWEYFYPDWISRAWNDFVDFKLFIFALLILLVSLMPVRNGKIPKYA